MRTRLFAILLLTLLALPAFATVTGTVMTRDGAPVAGAKVSLVALESAEGRRARVISKTPTLTPLVAGETDSKGNFKLETKESMATLRIEAKGYAPISLTVERDDDTGAIPLRVAPAITGTVTANGKPVMGATVIWSGNAGAEVIATTDDKGKYSVPDPNKWAARIVVHHPDFAIHDDNLGRSRKLSPDARLDAGVAVSGRVVGSDGAGIANAPVSIDGWPLTTSGEDGAFAIPHAPKKWEIIEARGANTLAYRTPGASPITLKLAPAASLTGAVRDAKTQRPVVGVEVMLAPATRFGALASLTSAVTDAKGVFTIPVVRPGSYRLMASHPAWSISGATINVAAGQKQQKQLAATELARISGSVADEEKRPVAAAMIRTTNVSTTDFMFFGPRDMAVVREFLSGPDGRFTIRTAGDAEMTVSATKKGFPDAQSSAFRIAAGERKGNVALTIPSGIAVAGRVLDAQGKPVSGVAVTASASQGGPGGMMFRRVISSGPDDDEGEVRTSSDGTFTIRLKEGKYDLGFKREGFAAKTLRAYTVVTSGLSPIEIKLEPGAEIAGRVVRGGVGIEGVGLSVIGPESQAFTTTGPDGSFVLGDLSPGTVMVNILSDQHFVSDMRSLSAPSRDVMIELPPGGRITGRVVEKGSRRPVTSFQAGISGSRSGGGMMIQMPPMLRSFTSEDGTFVLDNVPPGTVEVVAQAPGFTTGRVTGVTVEDGKTVADIEVGLDTGVKLYGKITGPDGTAVSGATIRQDAMRGGSRVMRFNAMDSVAVSDSNGEYSIDTLEPGEKTFSITHPTYLAQTKTVDLTGRETRLDVQLSAGLRVSGVVVTESGAPVPDAAIRASSAAGSNKSTRTDASGNFSFEALAPGRYNFTAQKSGYADGTVRDHDIASGAPVRVALKTGGVVFGRVSGLTDQELANTSVNVRSSAGWAQAAVDPSGNYRVEGAPTGSVQVSAEVERGFTERKSSPRKTVEVSAGSSVQVDLEFNSGNVVRGRVTRNGRPVENTMISFEPRDATIDTRASASTDSSGNYVVTGLSDAVYDVNVLDMRAMTPHSTTFEVRGGGTFDIDIRSVAVRGRVTDSAGGDPIEGAVVQLRPAGTSGTQSMRMSRGVGTNADGTFVMDGVAAGQYVVSAEKEGYGNAMVDISVGDTAPRDVELTLSKGSPLTIRVVDARDKRLLVARALLYDVQGRQVNEPTFRLGGTAEPLRYSVAPGQYRAHINATSYATVTVNLSAPGEHTVELTPGGTLSIRSTSGVPRQIRILTANGHPYTRPQNPDAIFSLGPAPTVLNIPNVAAGTYTVQALGPNGAVAASVQVLVPEGQTGTVDL